MSLAFATVAVLVVDLWQQLVDWVFRRWGQSITPFDVTRDSWFAFGTLDSGDLRGRRYWTFWHMALPVYGYHYDVCNDDYRWSRLRIAWWKGRFRHRWDAVKEQP